MSVFQRQVELVYWPSIMNGVSAMDGEKFDEFCERECAQFYAKSNGRPSLTLELTFGCF